MFSGEFFEIFQSTFFLKTPLLAPSEPLQMTASNQSTNSHVITSFVQTIKTVSNLLANRTFFLSFDISLGCVFSVLFIYWRYPGNKEVQHCDMFFCQHQGPRSFYNLHK